MKVLNVLKASFLLSLFGLFSLSVHGYNLKDTFETGGWRTTNAEGFKWDANKNRTSIVKQDAIDGNVLLCNGSTPTSCPVNSIINDGKDWAAKNGSNSMRFRYPSQLELDSGAEPWAEQRYDMGVPLREVYTSFWLRVPVNFAPRVIGKDNSKVFAIWMGQYLKDNVGTTVVVNMWSRPDGGVDIGISGEYKVDNIATYVTSSSGNKPFITSADKGRWMHLVFKAKHESSVGAHDGEWGIYRKWDGESVYTILKEDVGLDIPLPVTGDPAGFKQGYLLGWSNPSYIEETEYLLDDFEISGQSPLKRPMPPIVHLK
jgi:hypothetical protein